jgi:hypothetical protein
VALCAVEKKSSDVSQTYHSLPAKRKIILSFHVEIPRGMRPEPLLRRHVCLPYFEKIDLQLALAISEIGTVVT